MKLLAHFARCPVSSRRAAFEATGTLTHRTEDTE